MRTNSAFDDNEELRYVPVVYLTGKFARTVRSFQKKAYLLTGSKASLDLWRPHLSIAPPVWLKKKELKNFISDMERAISQTKAFKIKIKNFRFASRKGSYTVSLLVLKSKELENLTNKITKTLENKYQHDYLWPKTYQYHITVSYKDLDQKGFEKAKRYFSKKNFRQTFSLNLITIAKEEKTGIVKPYRKIKLQA